MRTVSIAFKSSDVCECTLKNTNSAVEVRITIIRDDGMITVTSPPLSFANPNNKIFLNHYQVTKRQFTQTVVTKLIYKYLRNSLKCEYLKIRTFC